MRGAGPWGHEVAPVGSWGHEEQQPRGRVAWLRGQHGRTIRLERQLRAWTLSRRLEGE